MKIATLFVTVMLLNEENNSFTVASYGPTKVRIWTVVYNFPSPLGEVIGIDQNLPEWLVTHTTQYEPMDIYQIASDLMDVNFDHYASEYMPSYNAFTKVRGK